MPLTSRTTTLQQRARSRAASAAALLAAAALVTGCSAAADPEPSSADGSRLRVVTTVAPLTSIVSQVAGDRADVVGLVPEGVNSHTFDPPPSAAAVLEDADLVVVNGLQLEEPTKELAEAVARDAELLELGDAVLPREDWVFDFSFPEEDGRPNPHLWTDPTYARAYAAEVRDALVRLDPDGAETYRANARVFDAQAAALDAALRADQESLPRAERELLTYHDAYAYFARTYGWTVVGAVQPSNFEDPTPRDVAALVDQVRELDVKAVFGSEVFPSPVLEQIGRETGTRYVDVLRDDDLPGDPGDTEHSWQGLLRFDYVTMIEALGGAAPRLRALDLAVTVPTSARYAP